MSNLELYIDDVAELYRVYMPFIEGGGLFFKSLDSFVLGQQVQCSVVLPVSNKLWQFTANVCWINPPQAQRGRPQGVGLSLAGVPELYRIIEELLGTKLNSQHISYTL
ncbi:PilZ domain-containing protein [Paraferrimonas sp. SM1919]|uniref:PilZ domain-containing protein n=1 Tax=Paraferrimonas sp. SM1919 TaxID=2662263 RepID=UPI0013D0AA08|nr:PilZ domain-containing protein [Paraferrimonas sp. SM1919]